MKNDRVYIGLVAGLFLLLVIGLLAEPKKISWNPSFSNDSKDPFASRALYEMLGDIFIQQPVETVRVPAYEFAHERKKDSLSGRHINYLLLKDYAQFDEYDTRAIWQIANGGDHVFISAHGLVGPLADSLGISTAEYFDVENPFADDTVRLNFTQTTLYAEQGFSMRPNENSMYISIPDSVNDINILSVNSKGKPVFIEKKVGKGAIYFHSVPLAFTNYYMLYAGNEGYISRCFSFMPLAPVYWDEFYKQGRVASASPIRVILNTPGLKMAYVLLLVMIALFMLFQSKRRQRIIPVIKPYENSTLSFVETVARLYYSKGDHTSLAKKKLLYFTEKIRLKYQVAIDFKSEESMEAVSARAGVDLDTTRKIFKFMEYIQRAYSLTETELINFNKQVEEFWRKAAK